MWSRKFFTVTILALGNIVLVAWFLVSQSVVVEKGLASVAMLDVGQGDSFLISSADGKRMLIDGGKDNGVLTELAKVLPASERTIDVVLATHPDADHIGGLDDVLAHYHVGLFLTSQVHSGTSVEQALLKKLEEKKIPSYYVRKGMKLSFDEGASFEILFPDRPTPNWETNTASVVGRVQIGERSMLLTGDSPESIESYLVKTMPEKIVADMVKLGHHGSKTSSGTSFLKTTAPALTLISAGVDNRYGHPAPEVLARLRALSIPFVSTQDHGTIIFTTNGITWTQKNEK